MMNTLSIGFIGAGNMARSLIGGLISSGVPASQIHASDPGDEPRAALHTDFGIHTHDNNQAIANECDVVVLAVKPQVLKEVATQLDTRTGNANLYLTVAAGIPTSSLQDWLGSELAIVRAMPNTPALVQTGATGLFANAHASEDQKATAESIMRAVGLTVWVENENHMDAVTALSGSGPAYFFLVMDAMARAGEKLGLNADTARLLSIQTAMGAAKLAIESDQPPSQLRKNVTSPGGTTEKAIEQLQANQLELIFEKAMQAAYDRAQELASELGK